jgi:hypothetical protein
MAASADIWLFYKVIIVRPVFETASLQKIERFKFSSKKS